MVVYEGGYKAEQKKGRKGRRMPNRYITEGDGIAKIKVTFVRCCVAWRLISGLAAARHNSALGGQ